MNIVKSGTGPLLLGKQGERGVTQVHFDLKPFVQKFGEGTARLTVKRPRETAQYAADVKRYGDTAIWEIGGEWTEKSGTGECELCWYMGDALAKSVTYRTQVLPAMGEGEDAPEPHKGYLDAVQQAGAQAMEAANRAEQDAEKTRQAVVNPPVIRGESWWIWDQEKETYVNSGNSALGPKGEKGDKGDPGPTIDEVAAQIEETLEKMLQGEEIKVSVASESDFSIVGFVRPAGTIETTSGYRRTDYIDISGFRTLVAHCTPKTINAVAPVVWFDAEKNYLGGETASTAAEYDFEIEVPAGAVYAIFSSAPCDAGRSVTGTRALKDSESLVEGVIASPADYSIAQFMKADGSVGTTAGYRRTDYISVIGCLNVKVNCYPNVSSVSPVVWFDAEKNYLFGEAAYTGGNGYANDLELFYEVPAEAAYAVFSSSTKAANMQATGTKVVDKMADIEAMLSVDVLDTLANDLDYSIAGFYRPAGTIGTTAGYRRTDYICVAGYKNVTVHCKPGTSSVAPVVWFDENKAYLSGEKATVFTETDFTYEVPSGAVYAIFSSATMDGKRAVGMRTAPVGDVTAELHEQMGKVANAQKKCYISPAGSDENDGRTADSPVKTLTQARRCLAPDGELIFLEGDYENFGYDLSLFAKVSTVGNVRLVYYAKKFSEATLVDGYTRIYAAPYTGSYASYLWQFDVPDEKTAISAEERHPLQRNRTCRLEHTRIYRVPNNVASAGDTTGYLAVLEATTDKWMYYTDGTNIYFTAPNTDLAAHPVIIPSDTVLRAGEERKVNISGLKIYFASILTTNLSGVLNGLTVGYHTRAGAIMWDNTFDLTLINCEVAASTNDGINGHYSGSITCVDCWGHDCSDDGESDHEKCHIVQYGGLYEYNGNGCTPASGASGEYINTIVRKSGHWDWAVSDSGSGFSAQGDDALMYCIGCHTDGCRVGYRQLNTSKATFINCTSKGDKTAFGEGTRINCDVFGEVDPDITWENLPDKPFHYGTVFYPETTVTLTMNEEGYTDPVDIPDMPQVDLDGTYILVVNGVRYKSRVYHDEMMGDTMLGADDYTEPAGCPVSVYFYGDGNGGGVYGGVAGGDYTVAIYNDDAKPIDESVLPYADETWTFTLEDGTTVTKQVVVK